MGVVRREGDWRLEKLEQGSYEITYQKEPQVKILTPDYEPDMFQTPAFGMSVKEVDSYSEAVGLFEEKAHGPSPMGMDAGDGLFGTSPVESDIAGLKESSNLLGGDGGSVEDDLDAPPGVIALALLLVGVFVVYSEELALNSTLFQVGALFSVGGVLILGWAGFIFRRKGFSEAMDFLWKSEDDGSGSSAAGDTEKTPPAPKKLREELMFNRANHHCEWCGERYDRLQIHHIKPRSEGGPNTEKNLIALCPTCHDKADHGGISRTQLRGKVRRMKAE